MWMLVFINVMYNAETSYDEPVVEAYYTYDTFEECFFAREKLIEDLGSIDGYPPLTTQAVCINMGEKT